MPFPRVMLAPAATMPADTIACVAVDRRVAANSLCGVAVQEKRHGTPVPPVIVIQGGPEGPPLRIDLPESGFSPDRSARIAQGLNSVIAVPVLSPSGSWF